MIDYGVQHIKKLLQIYEDSNMEMRSFILSRVKEIETETSCGLLIKLNYNGR